MIPFYKSKIMLRKPMTKWHYSWGDVDKHLLMPDRELMMDQSKDTTKVNFNEFYWGYL